jgi:hypothetical protein
VNSLMSLLTTPGVSKSASPNTNPNMTPDTKLSLVGVPLSSSETGGRGPSSNRGKSNGYGSDLRG